MRGRRSGSWNSGPQLPFKLTREIEGGSGGSLGGRHGGHGSRKDRRKAERQAKKHHGKPENSSFKGKKRGREVADEEQEERRSSKEGRFDEKKQRHGSGGSRRDTIPPPKSSTKFSELAPGAKQAVRTHGNSGGSVKQAYFVLIFRGFFLLFVARVSLGRFTIGSMLECRGQPSLPRTRNWPSSESSRAS